jgi:hypothetical protein
MHEFGHPYHGNDRGFLQKGDQGIADSRRRIEKGLRNDNKSKRLPPGKADGPCPFGLADIDRNDPRSKDICVVDREVETKPNDSSGEGRMSRPI